MPTPTTAKWPKPKNEDEFEDIVVDFLRIRWKDANAQRHGRRGQRQHGVDVVGHPPWLLGKTVGGQSKNTEKLTLTTVIQEVEEAKTFPGELAEFYVVTSGDRDAVLQNEVREHFKAHQAPFRVELLFWGDIVADLASDSSLVEKHWKGFVASENHGAGGGLAAASRHAIATDAVVYAYTVKDAIYRVVIASGNYHAVFLDRGLLGPAVGRALFAAAKDLGAIKSPWDSIANRARAFWTDDEMIPLSQLSGFVVEVLGAVNLFTQSLEEEAGRGGPLHIQDIAFPQRTEWDWFELLSRRSSNRQTFIAFVETTIAHVRTWAGPVLR